MMRNTYWRIFRHPFPRTPDGVRDDVSCNFPSPPCHAALPSHAALTGCGQMSQCHLIVFQFINMHAVRCAWLCREQFARQEISHAGGVRAFIRLTKLSYHFFQHVTLKKPQLKRHNLRYKVLMALVPLRLKQKNSDFTMWCRYFLLSRAPDGLVTSTISSSPFPTYI